MAERCNPEYGDLLITKSGTIGRVAVVQTGQPFSLFVSVALLKPANSQVLSKWIATAFEVWLRNTDIQQDVKGSAIKNLHLEDIRVLALPVPPLSEQHRIVAEVERRPSVIDELEMQVGANLKRGERLRRAILKRAFEGKLVPQDPDDEPASVLLERIRAALWHRHSCLCFLAPQPLPCTARSGCATNQ